MQDVPKIVRERLRAATPAVNHPDADVLTAFAERSLPELERDIVLEHLARCDDCRDVVALAVPASEAVEAAANPARGQWFGWPAIRWAFVAASIVAVAAVGVIQYQRRRPAMVAGRVSTYLQAPATVAKNEAATEPQATEAPPQEEKREATRAVHGDALKDVEADAGSTGARRAEAPAANVPKASYGHNIGGPVKGTRQFFGPSAPTQWQQNSNALQNQAQQSAAPAPATAEKSMLAGAPALAPAAAPPAQTVTVEVSSAAVPVSTGADAGAGSGGAVGKAKEPVKVETEAANLDAPADTKAQQELPVARNDTTVVGRNFAQLVEVTPMTRWTVTSAGGLQRSFDRGNTWQDVDVSASVSGNVAGLAAGARTARAKEKDKYLKKQLSGGPVFRAVTAIGAEVWAGGSGGALYHSGDGGAHWTPVVPSTAGSVLTGDVVALEFSDPQHGTVMTSTGERWTTADSGQSWQKP